MSKPTVYVGCDPGAKGYYCLLAPDTKQVAFFSNDSNPYDILEWFKRIELNYNLAVVMIEDVHSIYGMSAKSNFNFGRNVEKVNVLPMALNISVDLVKPKVWQKHIGVKGKSKQIKKDVAKICQRLYPKVPIYGPQGGLQDGKSDALMIAHYASQIFKI